MRTDGHHEVHSDGSELTSPGGGSSTAVLEVKGLNWASEKAVVESTPGRLEGVRTVEANPVAQTATVSYDPAPTNAPEPRRWVEECGYHCDGQSVPVRVCHPMQEPGTAGHPSKVSVGVSPGPPTSSSTAACSSAPPSTSNATAHLCIDIDQAELDRFIDRALQ